jgi:hypothetical protein
MNAHILFTFNFCISLYVYKQLSLHNVQNMVDYNYLVLFTSLCCLPVAGFRLGENAVGEL